MRPMTARRHEALDGKAGQIDNSPRILVVDDDPLICRLLIRFLSGEGYHVESVSDGPSMWRRLKICPFNLIVLDLRLPDGEDGLSLARKLRQESDVALIMLTGMTDNVDKVVGLELGADDYVTKPFEPRELLARIRSVLRRSASSRTNTAMPDGKLEEIGFSGWTLDLYRRRLTSPAGEPVTLTTLEFNLLAMFVRRLGRPLSRDQIAELILNRQWGPDDRSIDVLVGKLRRKLDDDPHAPRLIKTVRGTGYVFACPADTAAGGLD